MEQAKPQLHDNSINPRIFVAKGGKVIDFKIFSETTYNKIKSYVK